MEVYSFLESLLLGSVGSSYISVEQRIDLESEVADPIIPIGMMRNRRKRWRRKEEDEKG